MPLVQRNRQVSEPTDNLVRRPAVFYVVICLLGVIFVARLFYLEVIRGDHYRQQALAEHQKKFELPARRGVLYAHDGNRLVPIVLNDTRRLIYADTRYVKNADRTARVLKEVLGGDQANYKKLLGVEREYVVLAKNVSTAQGDVLKAKGLAGIGQTSTPVRVYPQGQLAAQVLGFVNGDGQGQYGLEEYFNKQLHGQTGQLKAVTDINGVPLASGDSSIQKAPEDGKDLHLTVDVNLQRFVEGELKSTTEKSKAKSASALVMNVKSGAVLAMGNYPTFNPNDFAKVTDYGVFTNRIISLPYEAGSVMKVFTMSAALNEGVVTKTSTFPDSGSVKVDDRTVKNSRQWGIANPTMTQVLQLSLNTGVVHLFKQLGGGEFNTQGRQKMHDYLTEHFHFGRATGVDLADEAPGSIPKVTTGAGDNVRYANMAFGQGMTVTQMQIAAGLSAVINGGTYHKPAILDNQTNQVLASNIVKPQVAADLRDMMRGVIHGTPFDKPGYYLGGKSGTAQLLDSSGNYTDDKTTGSYLGFIGSKEPEYVIMVRVDEPDSRTGFSGTTAAAPLFSAICGNLIQYYGIPPGS